MTAIRQTVSARAIRRVTAIRQTVSARAIRRALEALGREIDHRDAEIAHYRRLLAAERDARHVAEARLRRAERELAQYAPTVALDLPPATRPDLYAVTGNEGAA